MSILVGKKKGKEKKSKKRKGIPRSCMGREEGIFSRYDGAGFKKRYKKGKIENGKERWKEEK